MKTRALEDSEIKAIFDCAIQNSYANGMALRASELVGLDETLEEVLTKDISVKDMVIKGCLDIEKIRTKLCKNKEGKAIISRNIAE